MFIHLFIILLRSIRGIFTLDYGWMGVGSSELVDVGNRSLAGLVGRADPELVARILEQLVHLVREAGPIVDCLKPVYGKGSRSFYTLET